MAGSHPADSGSDSAERGAGSPPESDRSPARRRLHLILLLTPLSLAVIAGFVARALFPTLLTKAPLAIVALDPSNINLVATASLVDPVPFFLVATIRLFAVDPFTYVLGLRYGDAGVRWIERRFSGLKPTVELLEGIFAKAAPVAVALAPGAIVCTLAGAVKMRVSVFVAANLVGTVGRITALYYLGDVFSGPVDGLRNFFDRYLLWTTLASFVLVALWFWLERRLGRAEAETPLELAEELEHELGAEQER